MNIITVSAIALLSLSSIGNPTAKQSKAPVAGVQVAMTCFKTGENAPPGAMTKICYYDCLGSPVAITISSVSLCPLSINR